MDVSMKFCLRKPSMFRQFALISGLRPLHSASLHQGHRLPRPPTSRARPPTSRTLSYPFNKAAKMSTGFSNADTGSKPADPYKDTNKDEPDTEEKIKALSDFVSASKFGMMTTRIASSGQLVSRCMAVAGQVRRQKHAYIWDPKESKYQLLSCILSSQIGLTFWHNRRMTALT